MSGRDERGDGSGVAAAVAAVVGAVGAAAAAVGGRGYSPWLSAGSGPGRQGENEQQIWPTHPGVGCVCRCVMKKSRCECR